MTCDGSRQADLREVCQSLTMTARNGHCGIDFECLRRKSARLTAQTVFGWKTPERLRRSGVVNDYQGL